MAHREVSDSRISGKCLRLKISLARNAKNNFFCLFVFWVPMILFCVGRFALRILQVGIYCSTSHMSSRSPSGQILALQALSCDLAPLFEDEMWWNSIQPPPSLTLPPLPLSVFARNHFAFSPSVTALQKLRARTISLQSSGAYTEGI